MAKRKSAEVSVDALKSKISEAKTERLPLSKVYLKTGSALLNLALTDSTNGGYPAGSYIYVVGQSSSGKTFFTLTCMAEACASKAFRHYDCIYDPSEGGAQMDMEKFFGSLMAKRVQMPYPDKTTPHSTTIEECYFGIDSRLDQVIAGKLPPFIWVVDSVDALSSNSERKRFKENKSLSNRNKQEKGEFTDGKAKKNSQYLRQLISKLRQTGSILIFISQSRDNIDIMSFETETHAGGRALKFYADVQIWTKKGRAIKKRVREADLQIGTEVKLIVKKNRIRGKEWEISVPIYWSAGIDDLGSCIDYLVKMKHWKISDKGKINAEEFEVTGSREALVKHIEQSNLEKQLYQIVNTVWDDISEACTIKRKPRYA